MKFVMIVGVLLYLCIAGSHAGAAEADEPEVAAQETPAPQPAKPAAADTSSPEVFVPTEEISEDFAVPFPVDI
jgi:hypothetical protein